MESRFPLVDEPLALDLVNTEVVSQGQPLDLLTTTDDLTAWLRIEAERLGARPRPSADLLERLRALRADLKALFDAVLEGKRLPRAAVDRVNEASGLAPTFPVLELDDGAAHGREAVAGADPGATALAVVARSAIAILGGPERERVRRCEGPNCILLFLATNPRRQWCSPALCGNRVRVARHYARRHARD